MAPTHIRVTVYKVYGLPYRALENSHGCFFHVTLGEHTWKTQVISRLASSDVLEWTNEYHNFQIPSNVNSANILFEGFSSSLISFPPNDHFLGRFSISLADIRDITKAKLYKMTEAVSQAAKMKLEVAISFEDSKPKPVRPRYDSAPSEPDALNKKMDNRNANNFRKLGSLDSLPHLERSEMVTDQRYAQQADFIATLDQSEMLFSPPVTSSPAEAAFGAGVSFSNDATFVVDNSGDGQQQQLIITDHYGIDYGNLSQAVGGGAEGGDFTINLPSRDL